MEDVGFVFGIMGMSFGCISMVFAVVAISKVDKLEKTLTKQGVIEADKK